MIAIAPPPPADGRRSPAWASFHLHLPGRFEPFLGGPLLERVEEERARGRVRRFFFLRYGEGGLHLRLRFLPAPGVEPAALAERVEEWARAHVEAEGAAYREVRVEAHPYDRAELYFGETWDSVHAELLNEATSWLAMRLLRAQGMERRAHRW
ncbi:MAG TPA: lantibiotic dehydratase C-terminal domain-containing protein, partial [Longimicrobium sp.]|nr:lantibiotic dehydratase C-terminal domain-containing protein [Longimicrobium sp.]